MQKRRETANAAGRMPQGTGKR